MGKASGVSRRRRKHYNYQINRKKLQLKAKKKVKIECETIAAAWDSKKSMNKNLQQMGLSFNPNKTMPPPSTMEHLRGKSSKKPLDNTKPTGEVPVTSVVQDLEEQANAPQGKMFRLSQDAVNFCVYMLETHGDDYKAMARDSKNYYQETPKQIKKKLAKFKSVPEQWNGYLRAKGVHPENTTDDVIMENDKET